MKQRFTLFILITLLTLPFKNSFSQSLSHLSYAEELKSQGFLLDDKLAPFYHGVASGDPLSDRLIIWTRVTPPKREASKNDWKLAFSVSWKVATDTAFKDIVRNGDIATDETKDFTVKVDVTGLKPNTVYYYQFEAFGRRSITGTTKTAYNAIDELPVKLAFVDGNDFCNGYFNAFVRIAEIKDVNAVVVVSGYIDEGAGNSNLRVHIPSAKTETLQDYRNRYAQYHLDNDLMKAHASHPFIVVWERQSQDVASEKWDDAKKAAEQAFIEWLPVRVTKGEFQRKVSYGKMLDLYMIETQSQQNKGALASTNAILEEDISLLAQPQREWLTKQLNYSTSEWKVLVNRNLMTSINAEVESITSKAYDVWDNHPKDKESLLGFIRSFSLKNIIVATGGFHNALGAEIADANGYDPENGKYATVVEVSMPSVSSPSLTDQSIPAGSQVEAKCLNKTVNPHIKTANFSDHGFVIMSFSKKETLLNWYYMKENKQKNITKLKTQTELAIKSGVSILEK